MRNTRYLICIMLAVILALAGCGREPRSIDTPIIIPEETEAPIIEEGFEHITTGDGQDEQDAPPVTPDPPETSGSGVTLLTPMNGGQSGNTSPAPAPIVGDTEYNENQTELMRAMAVQYAQKMGYPPPYCESYVESFRTAKWPTDADYSGKSAEVPGWLYEGPVNRFSSMETKAEGSQYLNNVECLKMLGGKASQLVNVGKRHAEIYAFFDFVTDSKDTISSRLSMIYPAGHDVHQEAEDLYGSIMAKELTVEGFVLTDSSMLYRDADGLYRLRCSVFKRILHATPALYEQMECTQGTWREVDVEVVIGESEGAYIPLYENVVSPYYNVDPSMTEYINVIQTNGHTYP